MVETKGRNNSCISIINTMITLTKQQVIDFINSQPDDREVNMNQNDSEDSCGCLLIHLARQYYPDYKERFSASYTFVSPDTISSEEDGYFKLITDSVALFIVGTNKQATTYKDLKQQALTW